MKKITLGLFALLTSFAVSAQDSCANAVAVTASTTTSVATINGDMPDPFCLPDDETTAGEWYSYTASSEVLVTVTTNLAANTGQDTRIMVYEGSCGALQCYAIHDDVSTSNFLSTVQFVAAAGETYYFVFDNYWESDGFDFELTTSTQIPALPGQATNPTPADGATNVPIDEAETNSVDFAWNAPTTGDAPTSYFFYLGTSPSNLQVLGGTNGTSTPVPMFNPGTTYYWKIVPTNGAGGAENQPVWSFTTEGTASINDPAITGFSHFYNPTTQTLEVTATNSIDHVVVYSLLGQELISKKINTTTAMVDVSSIKQGIYIATINIEGKQQSIKFIKK